MAKMTRPKYKYHNYVRVRCIGTEYYTVCDRCGKEIDAPNAMKRKYCEECAAIVKREKNKERMNRYKERQAQIAQEKPLKSSLSASGCPK